MGSSTRRALLVAVLAGASGCVTGHLLDAARRWETSADVEAASLDGDRLALRYRATVTDDNGEPIGERRRSIVLRIACQRDGATLAVRTCERRRPAGRSSRRARERWAAHRRSPSSLGAGRPARLDLRDGRVPGASLYTNALARSSTATWAYPLLPFTGVVDVVSAPVLLFFMPAVLVIGE
jgi:hypothetical protein